MRSGGISHLVVRMPPDLLTAAAEDTLIPAEANDQECADGLPMAASPAVSHWNQAEAPWTLPLGWNLQWSLHQGSLALVSSACLPLLLTKTILHPDSPIICRFHSFGYLCATNWTLAFGVGSLGDHSLPSTAKPDSAALREVLWLSLC